MSKIPTKESKMSDYPAIVLGYTVVSRGLVMKKYGKFAALIVVVIGTLVWLATAEMKENQTYYKTITELGQMGDKAYDARIRVGGDVEAGSIQRVGSECSSSWRRTTHQAQGRLHRHRSAARTPSRTAPRRWPTASWAKTASSVPTEFRPNARPSTKPSRGSSSPDRPLPTSTPAKRSI